MANKARPPMTKPEEVIAWAEETNAGNGEAFTMLKKEEQLLIAKFILAMRDHIKMLKNTTGDGSVPPSETKNTQKQSEIEDNESPREMPCKVQSNIEFFKANEVSMQRAYELYCVWRNCDPQNRTIFDDERKAWVKAAAFAFWLNLPHE